MSGYIANLLMRTFEPARTLRPALPPLFAAPQPSDGVPFDLEREIEIESAHEAAQAAPAPLSSASRRAITPLPQPTPQPRTIPRPAAEGPTPPESPLRTCENPPPVPPASTRPAQQTQPAPVPAAAASQSRVPPSPEIRSTPPVEPQPYHPAPPSLQPPAPARAPVVQTPAPPSSMRDSGIAIEPAPLRHSAPTPREPALQPKPGGHIQQPAPAKAPAIHLPSTPPAPVVRTPRIPDLPPQLRGVRDIRIEQARRSKPPEPVIAVTIGRIDVRGPAPAENPRVGRRQPPAVPLDDYLRSRSRRGRS